MRIIFLSHYFYPEGNAPASRTYENCKRWVRAGHKVTVITCAPNVPTGKVYPGYTNKLAQKETIDGIEVLRVWTYLAPNSGTVKRILNYLSYMFAATLRGLAVPRPDVVISTSPQFFCGWAGVFVSLAHRTKFVLEIRDIWPESIEAVGALSGRMAIRFLSLLERSMYKSADHIVTVGRGYKEKLIDRGVPTHKVSIVTNGADLEFYAPGVSNSVMRSRYGLDGKLAIAYVGTVGMACGLDCVIGAGKQLESEGEDRIRYLIVGDGARKTELEAAAAASGVRNVAFAGRIEKDEIPDLLRTVDVCLVHLRRAKLFESVLPSKIFEAFASGRPVIIGVKGEAQEIVQKAAAGIAIEPESVSELVAASKCFLDNPDLVGRMGKRGRSFVVENYSRDSLAKEYLRCLQRVIKPRFRS